MDSTQVEQRKTVLKDRLKMYGKSLTSDVAEHIQTLDEYVRAYIELEELNYGTKPPFVSGYLALPKGMVVLCGSNLPLIQDYIDDNCKLVVTEEAYKAASRAQM